MSYEKKETLCIMTPSMISKIEAILTNFLKECEMSYPRNISYDHSFRTACYADAARRGLDLAVIGKALDVGIAIVDAAYRHIKNDSTRIFFAVWTGLMVHLDDADPAVLKGLEEFLDRFHAREPQALEVLNQVATMTNEISNHWGTIASNLVIITELEFINSLLIDKKTADMEIHPSLAPSYPYFMRSMNGVSRAYCVMTFPPELDLEVWVQVLPDLMYYVNYANDLFSFFKEELEGESLNFISMNAKSNGITKIEALGNLADSVAQCYKRGLQILQQNPAALEAFQAFCVGYVGFHALSTRYRLDQLNL